MRKVNIQIDQDGEKQTYDCLIAQNYIDLPKRIAQEVVLIAYTQPKNWENRLEVWDRVFFCKPEVREILTHPDRIDELLRLLEFTEWAWSGGFEKRPLEYFWPKGNTRRFYLPDENLQHVSTGEFITATAYIVAFAAGGSSEAEKFSLLNRFVATICRPRVSVVQRLTNKKVTAGTDIREPFNSYQVDARAEKYIKPLHLSIHVMVLEWFLTVTQRVQAQYGMIASEDESQSAILQVGLFVRDWEQTVHDLAHAGNFGRYDDVMNRPIHDVLAWLELRKIEADKKANTYG